MFVICGYLKKFHIDSYNVKCAEGDSVCLFSGSLLRPVILVTTFPMTVST